MALSATTGLSGWALGSFWSTDGGEGPSSLETRSTRSSAPTSASRQRARAATAPDDPPAPPDDPRATTLEQGEKVTRRAAAEPPESGPHEAPAREVAGEEATPRGTVEAGVAYDEVRLQQLLDWAVRKAERCHKRGRAVGSADLLITFSPSGKVSNALLVGEPIASAPVARCVLDYARALLLPPFDGPELTVSRSIVLR